MYTEDPYQFRFLNHPEPVYYRTSTVPFRSEVESRMSVRSCPHGPLLYLCQRLFPSSPGLDLSGPRVPFDTRVWFARR